MNDVNLLREAIHGMQDPDPQKREYSVEFCEKFKNPQNFSFDVFYELSKPESDLGERIFAYNTLITNIKDNWLSLSPDARLKILTCFPFNHTIDMQNDKVLPTIARAAAVYLAYQAPIEIINDFFQKQSESNPRFALYTFNEYVSFVFSKDFPRSRSDIFRSFNDGLLVKVMGLILFKPLTECDEDSPEFAFYMYYLSEIHQNAAPIIEKNLEDPFILSVYNDLCTIVWTTECNTLISVFETILERDKVPDQIISNLIDTLPRLIESNENLFVFDAALDKDSYYNILQNFHIKLRLLLALVPKAKSMHYFNLLSSTIDLLESIFPSIVLESSSAVLQFLKQHMSSTEFKEQYLDMRKRIVNICMAQLIFPVKELPGAQIDETSFQQVNSQLQEIIRLIIDNYDYNVIVLDFFDLLINEMGRTESFTWLMKIISLVINPDRKSTFGKLAVSCSIDLLSSLNSFESSTQSKVCNFLTKLIPVLDFSDFSANDFFQELIDLLMEAKPIALEPFSQYITQFASSFSNVKIPIEKLKSVPQKLPVYTVCNRLLVKYGETGHQFNKELDKVIQELEWLTNQFKPKDKPLKRLSTDIVKKIPIITEFPSNEWANLDHIQVQKICSLLIASSNVFVRISDESDSESVLNQIISAFIVLSPAILKMATVTPDNFIKFFPNMASPTVYKPFAVLWLKKLAYPLLTILYKVDNSIVSARATSLSKRYLNILTELRNNPKIKQMYPSAANDEKKIANTLCDICDMLPQQLVIEILQECMTFADLSVFTSVSNAITKQDFLVLKQLWPIIITKKDQTYIDKISEILLKFLTISGNVNCAIFRNLDGVTEKNYTQLSDRIGNAKVPRSMRRILRTFIIDVQHDISV